VETGLILIRHIIAKELFYTLSEAWSGVNWADLMAAQGAFGTDFYDRSILRLKHRAYSRSGRPVIKIGPKGTLGSHEIRPIHSAPSLGQSILRATDTMLFNHGLTIIVISAFLGHKIVKRWLKCIVPSALS